MTSKPTSKNAPKGCQASRRQFLQTTAGAIAATAVIRGCDKESASGPDGGDNNDSGTDPNGNNNGNDNGNNNTGPAPANRVVRVVDSSATSWDGDDASDFYQYAEQTVVDSMMEAGILSLTAKSSIEEAWQSLITYNDGELIALHVNAYATNDNSRKNNVCEPISAIIHGLVDVLGVPAENIVALFDAACEFGFY